MEDLIKKRSGQSRNQEKVQRPRGRPLKEKQDTSTDVQRARVRRAQKAFRERKEKYVNGLESKVSGLEIIIEEMSTTFLEFSDDLLKSRKVDLAKVRQTTEIFLALSHRASRTLDEENEEPEDSPEPVLKRGGNFSSETRRNSLNLVPGTSYAQEFRVSDLYRNSIWGLPQNSSKNGKSAIPYILAGRDSFSSRLYFESIAMIVRALRGEAFVDILDSVYRYKRRYVNYGHILGVTSAVLNILLHGTSQDPKEPNKAADCYEPDESVVKAVISQDLVLEGSSEMEFLDTWKVERYLQERWGLGVNSTTVRTSTRSLGAYTDAFSSDTAELTEQNVFPNFPKNPIPFAPTMLPGVAHSEQHLFDAQSLLEKIVLGAVSLGEGPRWHVSFIDGAVTSFLRDNRARNPYD